MNTFTITCLQPNVYEAQHNQTKDVYIFFGKKELCEFLDAYYTNPICALFAYEVA